MIKQFSQTKTHLALSLVLLLFTAACTPPETETEVVTPPDDTAQTESGTVTAPAAETDETEVGLAIAKTGVLLIQADTGSTQFYDFETDIAPLETALTSQWGAPEASVENPECPAGPITVTTWANGFSINAMDGKFVGWNIRPTTPSSYFQTVDGISIGSLVSDIQGDVEITNSTLGEEFFSGGLSGLLSGSGDNAIIEDLWAGTNCIFR